MGGAYAGMKQMYFGRLRGSRAIGSSFLLFMKDEKGAGQSNRSNLERITSAPRFEYGLSWHETAAQCHVENVQDFLTALLKRQT